MEPISTIIAGAIAMGAAAGIEPTVEQAVKDAYAGLKKLITDRYADNDDVTYAVEGVTRKPEAEKRRAALEEALEEAGAEQDTELAGAAKQVVDAVQVHAPELAEAIGMDIGTLKANKALQFVFASLTVLFWLLAAGHWMKGSGAKTMIHIAGWEGIICGASAIYLAMAEVIEEQLGKSILPIGKPE